MSTASELSRLSAAMGRLSALGAEDRVVTVSGLDVRVLLDPCDGRTVRRLFVGSGVGADGRVHKADVLDYTAIPAEALAAIVDYVAALGA